MCRFPSVLAAFPKVGFCRPLVERNLVKHDLEGLRMAMGGGSGPPEALRQNSDLAPEVQFYFGFGHFGKTGLL